MKRTKTKILSVFLSFCMIISWMVGMSVTASAAVTGSGTQEDPWQIGKETASDVTAWLTGEDNNKTLHISGTGAMADFLSTASVPWRNYRNSITSVSIGESVTSIGNYAFNYCFNLTSVTIPNNVTSIGESAFVYCSQLTSISLPSGVTSIGVGAFNSCSNLATVTFNPGTANTQLVIGELAFANTANGAKVAYGTGDAVLFDDTTEIKAGDLLTTIYSTSEEKTLTWTASSSTPSWTNGNVTATLDGTKLTVEKTGGAETGDMDVFWEPVGTAPAWADIKETITEIEIKDGVTDIGTRAFSGCKSLASVTIPDSVTVLGNIAFLDCEKLESVTIPNSVTSILSLTFEGCSSLTSVTIPNSVTDLGAYTFNRCTSLSSVTIPDSVTLIGVSAFRKCESLTSITIPNSLTFIPDETFYGCISLSSVTFTPGTADTTLKIGNDTFYNTKSGAKVSYGTGNTVLYNGTTEITTDTLLTEIQNKTLTWKSAHTHSFTYSASSATITATCSVADCPLTDSKATLTLVKPTLTTYGGTGDATATLTGLDAFNSATGLNVTATAIKYYEAEELMGHKRVGDELAQAPTGVGDYFVGLTLSNVKISESETDDVKVYVPYTIAKGTPTITTAPTASAITYGQTLANSNLTGGEASVAGSFAWTTPATKPAVTDSGTTPYEVTFTPADTDNYNTAACTVTLTVNKAEQTAPTGIEAFNETYDGSADGKITGVNSTMEYRRDGETTYTAITGTEITGLAAGTYKVRYKETATKSASPDTDAVINTGSKITVTFDTNGGLPVPATQERSYGQKATKPVDPEKTGNTFRFWTLDGTTAYDFGTELTSNITLKALYKINQYTVTFDAGYDNNISTITLNYGDVIPRPTPVRAGYTFAGWSSDIPYTMPAYNLTFTAQWLKTEVRQSRNYYVSFPDISNYNISAKVDKNNVINLKWDAINGAKNNTLYVEVDGSYAPLRNVYNATEARVAVGRSGRYYVTAGKQCWVYEYDKQTGKFVNLGYVDPAKIDTIAKSNNTTVKFMVGYDYAGYRAPEANSHKVSATVAYKPVLKLSTGVNSTTGKSYITAKCDNTPNATMYRFYKYDGKKLRLITETTNNAIRINGTKPGQEYTLAVKALINGKWTTVTMSDLKSIKSK